MVDPTIIGFSNSTAPLVIKSVIETNQFQFWTNIVLSLVISFWFMFYLLAQNGGISAFVARIRMKHLTGRSTLVVAHNESGLFSVSMIDQKTLNTVTRFLRKHKGEDVNLVLHTPGGNIFHSMALSTLIKNHGRVHVYVPVMAMSGGTLLSVSAAHLHLARSSVVGGVDPQLGLIWTQGSADDWRTVVKKKGAKSGDTSIIMDNEGVKYTKLIRDHLVGLGVPLRTAVLLTDGKLPHAHLYYYKDVSTWGLPGVVSLIVDDKVLDVCVNAVTK